MSSTPPDQVPPHDQVHPPRPGTPPQDRPGTPPKTDQVHPPKTDQVHPQDRPGTLPQDQVHPPRPGTPPKTGQVHPPEYGLRAAGMHPTGMHSCYDGPIHVYNADTPPGRHLLKTLLQRTVCILLECILV